MSGVRVALTRRERNEAAALLRQTIDQYRRNADQSDAYVARVGADKAGPWNTKFSAMLRNKADRLARVAAYLTSGVALPPPDDGGGA